MKNKQKQDENYLLRIPQKNESINWSLDNDLVTLEIENKGIMNRILQKLIKKPKISYIHLDEFGSFVWTITDGEKNIEELGKLVYEKFGDEANPLYERLAKYFEILKSYNFISFK